nr:unnamed protein product [Callosobruchus chinensis]
MSAEKNHQFGTQCNSDDEETSYVCGELGELSKATGCCSDCHNKPALFMSVKNMPSTRSAGRQLKLRNTSSSIVMPCAEGEARIWKLSRRREDRNEFQLTDNNFIGNNNVGDKNDKEILLGTASSQISGSTEGFISCLYNKKKAHNYMLTRTPHVEKSSRDGAETDLWWVETPQGNCPVYMYMELKATAVTEIDYET